jgi:hypothetical protein
LCERVLGVLESGPTDDAARSFERSRVACGTRHRAAGPAHTRGAVTPQRRPVRLTMTVALGSLVVAGCIWSSLGGTGTSPGSRSRVSFHLASDDIGNASLAEPAFQLTPALLQLTPATSEPAPAPPALASEPPIASHEVFAFAPYWTLGQSPTFDVSGLSTIAYFAVGVNADGTLDEAGPGWDGFESQQLVSLISRSHAAGDRVVLTVNCFTQSALNSLTSSPTAPGALSAALVSALEAKRLDGVNLDFEGAGNEDQRGLTNLVSVVSASLHAVDPAWQVTMDTYASSAGDPTGFYDIPALSPVVDGFFVMAYQLNFGAQPGPRSPLTDTTFSNERAVEEYASVVTPKKVILGLATFGYDWPTANGALGATAEGSPSVITYGQEIASGHPLYWDPVTDVGWTSYTSDGQWHQAFFEVPASLYMSAKLAQSAGLAGVGVWALGFDGSSRTIVDALDGRAPAEKGAPSGSGGSTLGSPPGEGPNSTTPAPPTPAPTGDWTGTGSSLPETTSPDVTVSSGLLTTSSKGTGSSGSDSTTPTSLPPSKATTPTPGSA